MGTKRQMTPSGFSELPRGMDLLNHQGLNKGTAFTNDVLAVGTYGPKKECRIKEQADHNLMYLLSVALLDGEIWPEQFTEERINRSDVQDLMKK